MEKRGEKREGVPVVILLVPWMKYRLAVSGLLPPFLSSSSEFLLLLLLLLSLVHFNYSPSNVSHHPSLSLSSLQRWNVTPCSSSTIPIPIRYFSYFSESTSSGPPSTYHYHTSGNTTGPSITFYQRGMKRLLRSDRLEEGEGGERKDGHQRGTVEREIYI